MIALDGGEELPNGNRRKPGRTPDPCVMLKGSPEIQLHALDPRWCKRINMSLSVTACKAQLEEACSKYNQLKSEWEESHSNFERMKKLTHEKEVEFINIGNERDELKKRVQDVNNKLSKKHKGGAGSEEQEPNDMQQNRKGKRQRTTI